jgi:hypothetical protein
MDVSLYYDGNTAMSYNRMLTFTIGGRSTGKTYFYKRHCVKQFKKNGKMFAYVRRYKDELKGLGSFFDAIKQEFPDDEFTVKGRELFINGKKCGQAFQLSKWQTYKSQEYPDYDFIMFDEFIREKDNSNYIPEDCKAFLNLMHTIFRDRPNTRAVCLSNAVSIVNPYFLYFKLVPDVNKRYNAYRDALIEIPPTKEFADAFRQTRFGQLIDGTDYGDMALDNEFTGDNYTFVEKRSKNSRFQFTIIYKGMNLGLWTDSKQGLMFISQDHDPSTKMKFALLKSDMTNDSILMNNWKQNFYLSKMISAFKKGYLRFDNQVIRTTSYEMFNKMNVQ